MVELNITKIAVEENVAGMVCQFNVLLNGDAIMYSLLAFYIVISIALYNKHKDILISFFATSGFTAFISVMLFFVRVEGCAGLLTMKQMFLFVTLFLIAGLLVKLENK